MKRKYHVNFSKDSPFPSEIHSYKLLLYCDLFSISNDLNRHIFESIFNRLAVHRYIPVMIIRQYLAECVFVLVQVCHVSWLSKLFIFVTRGGRKNCFSDASRFSLQWFWAYFFPPAYGTCALETRRASLHRICVVRHVHIAWQCVLPPAVFYFRYALDMLSFIPCGMQYY